MGDSCAFAFTAPLPPDGGVRSDFWRNAESAVKSCSVDFRLQKVSVNRPFFGFGSTKNTNFHRFLHRCGKLWEETKFHTPHSRRSSAADRSANVAYARVR